MFSCTLATLVGLPALLAAQEQPVVAFPQDATFLTVSTSTPFGLFAVQPEPEGRYQMLVPRDRMPTRPSIISGLAVVTRPTGGVVDYARLQITLATTDAAALGTDFAANLTAPQVVFERTGQFTWNNGTWTTLQFDTPFAFDGQSGLVVEVRKEIVSAAPFFVGTASTGTSQTPPNGLPNAIWTTGARGSGSWGAARSTGTGKPIQLRLLVDTPTITVRSEIVFGGPRYFAPGFPVELAAYGAAGSCFCAVVDTQFQSPYSLPGVLGSGHVLPLVEFPLREIPAGGRDVLTFTMPPNPSLSGAWFMLQAAFVPPQGLPTWSNALAFQCDSQ